jgi:hypothetical protein
MGEQLCTFSNNNFWLMKWHRLAAYPVMNSMAAFDGQLLHRP